MPQLDSMAFCSNLFWFFFFYLFLYFFLVSVVLRRIVFLFKYRYRLLFGYLSMNTVVRDQLLNNFGGIEVDLNIFLKLLEGQFIIIFFFYKNFCDFVDRYFKYQLLQNILNYKIFYLNSSVRLA